MKTDFGLATLLKRVKSSGYKPFDYQLKEQQSDLLVVGEKNPKFIDPILSVVNDYSLNNIDEAQIILIEAVGAAGKTELTKAMSHSLQCPVFHLGKTNVVAANSLTGLLVKRMATTDFCQFLNDIEAGKSTLIIDALDEGYLKTNNQGYMDFLDDVISIKPQKECPVIMLGRYNAVELAACHLMDKEVPFVTLQIEPFTLQKARDFIDKSIASEAHLRYESIYKETRDFILKTIDGFFKDQASIKKDISRRFIGYAPVLQSIAAFFSENINYHRALDEMKETSIKSVTLVVDILERILRRDKEEKVSPILLDSLLKDRDENFRNQIMNQAFDFDEQCARILYKVLKKPFPQLKFGDASFLATYNEHVTTWVDEHPFLGKGEIANAVFESYILARLSRHKTYQDVVYEYMCKHRVSYMFAYIYQTMYGFRDLDKRILPYIYISFCELNNKQSYYSMSLDSQEGDKGNDEVFCELEFEGSDDSMERYKGNVSYSKDDVINLGSRLEHLNISVPLDFELSHRMTELVAPSYIRCKDLLIASEEIAIYKSDSKATFMFECCAVNVRHKYEQYLQIVGPAKHVGVFNIVCPQKLDYPLYEYWNSKEVKLKGFSDDLSSRYLKLRATILEFRSHSKKGLAKHHERIDFVIGNTDVGRAVIAAMKEHRIMYQYEHLYVLDTGVMDKVLALSYDGIRNFERPKEVVEFLNSITV